MRPVALLAIVTACGTPAGRGNPAPPSATGATPPAIATSLDSPYLRHGGRALAIASVPGTPTLVSLGADRRIHVWRTDTATLVRSIEIPDQMTQLAVSADGAWIAAAGSDHLVMFSAATGAVRWTVDWHYYQPRALAFFMDDRRLFVAADTGIPRDGYLGVLDAATGDAAHVFTGRIDARDVDQLKWVFGDAVVAPTGAWAAAAMQDGPVVVVHADGTRRELAIEHPRPLAVTADGAWLVGDGWVDIAWRTSDWSAHPIDLGPAGSGTALLAVPGTSELVAVDTKRFTTAAAPRFAPGDVHAVRSEHGAPHAVHGGALASWHPEGIVLRDRATGARLTPDRVHAGPVVAVDVSPRGDRALTAATGVVHLWSLPDGAHLASLPIVDGEGAPAKIESLRWRADGSSALVAAGARVLQVAAAGALTATPLAEVAAYVELVAPAPTGRRWAAVVADDWNGSARLVIGAPDEEPRVIDRWTDYREPLCLDFTADGRLVLGTRNRNTPFGSGQVTIHDLETGTKDTAANTAWASCATSRAGVHATVQAPDPGYSMRIGDVDVALTRLADLSALGRYALRIARAQVRFSPDGTRLAVAAGAYRPMDLPMIDQPDAVPDRVIILDATTAAELQVISGHAGEIHDLAFSPDGKTLYGASDDGTVHIWPLAR